MTREAFQTLLKRLQDTETALGLTKGVEYTQTNDRLDNFKRIGVALGVDPKVVCFIYLQKHLDAILHFVKNGETLSEGIEDRIVDARHYLALLYGLIVEQERRKINDPL